MPLKLLLPAEGNVKLGVSAQEGLRESFEPELGQGLGCYWAWEWV